MANINLRRIGSRLKKARVAKHLTQEQLAEMVDKSTSQIAFIERGERAPGFSTFLDIISTLEVTADSVLCDAVDYVSGSRFAEYDSYIEKLPKAKREKFFKMLDVYFGRD